ncbi:MAG: dihydrofolate reductase [Patescibacteria group bacterium]|nr:dihydrofolate reductase [Patescibacteria group bacterium]
MKLSSIVIVGKNREIGCNNQLLWNIPADMARFKYITTGHPVIMGDRTFESIGSPLPGRTNIVISLKKNYKAPGCTIAHSIENSIECAKKHSHDPHSQSWDVNKTNDDEAFVIGGGTIYKLFMPLIDKLYITEVDDTKKADVYFPDYSDFKKVIFEQKHKKNNLKFTFKELKR